MPDTDTQGVALDVMARAAYEARAQGEYGFAPWDDQPENVKEVWRRVADAVTGDRVAQEGREAVAWPRIMYICEYCQENNPEMCGHDRNDLCVTPDGRWLCEGCLEEEGISHADCASPPKLYPHPAPAQPAAQVVNRAQGMVRSMDQWRNMVPKAVAEGSQAQVEYALHDAKHDIEAMWCALSALASPTDADAAVVTEAEVERAAKAIYELKPFHSLDNRPEPLSWAVYAQANPYLADTLRKQARAALTAAKAGEDGRD